MNLPSNVSVPVISVIVGVAILLFGRKLFWLFVAALGFAVGVEIAAYSLSNPPVWVTVLIVLGLGFCCAPRGERPSNDSICALALLIVSTLGWRPPRPGLYYKTIELTPNGIWGSVL